MLTYQHLCGNTLGSIWNSEAMTEIYQQVTGGEATYMLNIRIQFTCCKHKECAAHYTIAELS